MTMRMHHADEDFEVQHEINVTPFIDVMLVLMIIFMIAAPLATVELPLDLPVSTAAPTAPEPDPVVLSVQPDLTLALGETKIGRDQLGAELEKVTKGNKNTRIYLRADKKVAYGDLIDVMDAMRKAGYLKVALVTLESGI
jgi:TonB system transport protein ExbD (group 1)